MPFAQPQTKHWFRQLTDPELSIALYWSCVETDPPKDGQRCEFIYIGNDHSTEQMSGIWKPVSEDQRAFCTPKGAWFSNWGFTFWRPAT